VDPLPESWRRVGEHYVCDVCKVEWVYRDSERQWYRFDQGGRVVEMIPPRPKLFGDKNIKT
jgi:hypothetical protein